MTTKKKTSKPKAPKKKSAKKESRKSRASKEENERQADVLAEVVDAGHGDYTGTVAPDEDGHGFMGRVYRVEHGGEVPARGPEVYATGLVPTRDDVETLIRAWTKSHSEHLAEVERVSNKLRAETFEFVNSIESEIIEEEGKLAKLKAKTSEHKANIQALHTTRREYLARANDPQLEFSFSGLAPSAVAPEPEKDSPEAPTANDSLVVLTPAKASKLIAATADVETLEAWRCVELDQDDVREDVLGEIDTRIDEIAISRETNTNVN